MRVTTHTQFMKKLNRTDIKVIGKYAGSKKHIEVQCLTCNHQWNSKPDVLYAGRGCPSCYISNTTKTLAQFKDDIKDTIEIIGDYINTKHKVKVKCTVCKHEWKPKAQDLQKWHGCPKCVGLSKVTTKVLKERLIGRDITLLSECTGSHHKLTCKCDICDTQWHPTSDSLRKGSGCPTCADSCFKLNEPAELYLYNIDDTHIGYGITGSPKQRHNVHRINLNKAEIPFEHIHSFSFDKGSDAYAVEQNIKKKFICIDTGIEGFRTEATSINNLNAVLSNIRR